MVGGVSVYVGGAHGSARSGETVVGSVSVYVGGAHGSARSGDTAVGGRMRDGSGAGRTRTPDGETTRGGGVVASSVEAYACPAVASDAPSRVVASSVMMSRMSDPCVRVGSEVRDVARSVIVRRSGGHPGRSRDDCGVRSAFASWIEVCCSPVVVHAVH